MIDLADYGFTLCRGDDGFGDYSLTASGYTIRVFVTGNLYSISMTDEHGNTMDIAQRYMCDTKEQVEFLLFNNSWMSWIIKKGK